MSLDSIKKWDEVNSWEITREAAIRHEISDNTYNIIEQWRNSENDQEIQDSIQTIADNDPQKIINLIETENWVVLWAGAEIVLVDNIPWDNVHIQVTSNGRVFDFYSKSPILKGEVIN